MATYQRLSRGQKMSDITTKLRVVCGHDSRSVAGCTTCEASDMIDDLRRMLAKARAPQSPAAQAEPVGNMQAGRDFGPNEVRLYTAGIHVGGVANAIECHAETLSAAQSLRDSIMQTPAAQATELAALRAAQAEPVADLWQHDETGRMRIVLRGDIHTENRRWLLVGPLFLGVKSTAGEGEK
jgi:hypothetical protein